MCKKWHSLLIITWTCFILLSWRAIIWTRLLRAAQVNHSQLLGPFWQSLKKHIECTKWSNVYTRGVLTIERALESTRQNLLAGIGDFGERWRALSLLIMPQVTCSSHPHVSVAWWRDLYIRIEFKTESLSTNFSIG